MKRVQNHLYICDQTNSQNMARKVQKILKKGLIKHI